MRFEWNTFATKMMRDLSSSDRSDKEETEEDEMEESEMKNF